MSGNTRLDNPYPGLRPFHFSESQLFFGRERQSEELLRKLRRNRFLAVVGTSGSGKSSLVRAGLLPLLDGGAAADAGERWRIALFRPGRNPINNLALALNSPEAFRLPYAEAEGAAEGESMRAAVIETVLRRSALGLTEHARRVARGGSENLLVCVDQFEELFRFKEKSELSSPEDEAAAFVKLLLEAARGKDVAVYVLLTMRSDFLGECSQFRDLPEAINEGQYLIPRMSRDEQRRAIAEPATRRGVELTPRLVQRLLNDVGDNPDQLPLLQHALMRTWDYWRETGGEGDIDLAHYNSESVGGMEKALSKHAQQTYDALPDDGRSRRIAEKLFKALTETIANNREIRRPAELSELCAVCATDATEVVPVIDHFRKLGRSFLMPPPGTKMTGETVLDISHESLIKGWELLKKWVEEEARSKAMYQRVADAARRRYREEGSAGLWRDPDLKFALDWRKREQPNKEWASRYDPNFEDAMKFLEESEAEREREHKEREANLLAEREREERDRARELKLAQDNALQQQRIAEAERQRAQEAQLREDAEHQRAEERSRFARTLKYAIVVLAFMFILMSGIAVYAYIQKNEALRLKNEALEQKQRADDNAAIRVQTAIQLAIKSAALKEELEKSETLSNERETARKDAEEQKALAEEQKTLALDNAKKLQVALDAANTARDNEKKAREREDLERNGLISIEKGEPEQAQTNFDQLLKVYEKDTSPEGQIKWSWASYNSGTAYRQEKDYANAFIRFRKALETQRKLFGDGNPDTIPALTRVAQAYHDMGSYKEADDNYISLESLLESLRDRAAASGNQAKTNDYRARLIGVKRERAKLFQDEARDLATQALQAEEEGEKLDEKLSNLKSSSDPASLSAEQRQGVAKSEERIRKLNDTEEKLTKSSEEKYAAAEEIYKRVAEDLEGRLPESHAELVEAYNDLAAFYQERALSSDEIFIEDDENKDDAKGMRGRASELYKLARAIRLSGLITGSTYKDEANKLEKLAMEFHNQKRYGAVASLINGALSIRRSYAAPELNGPSAGVDSSLALLRTLSLMIILQTDPENEARSNRDDKAQMYYQEIINVLLAMADKPAAELKRYGDDNTFEASATGFNVGGFLYTRNRFAEAQRVIKLDIAIQRKALPNYDDGAARAKAVGRLAQSFLFLGFSEYKLGNYSAAEDAFKAYGETLKDQYGQDTEMDYSVAYVLAKFYSKQGRYADALPRYQRILTVFGNRIGPRQRAAWPIGSSEVLSVKESNQYVSPSYYLTALLGTAEIHSRQGRDREAEQTYEELLDASQWMLQHPEEMASRYQRDRLSFVEDFKKVLEGKYADALESYAAFLKKPEVGRAAEAKPLEEKAAEIRGRLGPKKEDPIFN